MSYYEPPRRRRTLSGPLLLLAAVAACLVVAAGAWVGWQLLGQDPAASPATAVEETSVLEVGVAIATPTVQATRPPTVAAAPSATSVPTLVVAPPDVAALQALALDLINQDRAAAGLSPVVWDVAAAGLAQRHAEDMLDGQFFSHWNRDGYGPDQRAALKAGMTDAVFENIHTYWLRFDDGRPAPIEDWSQRVREAQEGWMNSPGHRANILAPAHTHVGVGIAYRPDLGELRLVQEFVNRYVELDPLPQELPLAAAADISGRLLNGATDPLINLAYEPFPRPLSQADLERTGAYRSEAQPFGVPDIQADGDRFQARLQLDHQGRPGLYHVRVFVSVHGERVLAADPIVVVQ